MITIISAMSISAIMVNGQSALDVQGHRGCRGLMPENTTEGFLKAIEIGVSTLEMDVVISGDMQVIVSHEPYFNHEISTKPDGTPVKKAEELDLNIYKMSFEEIQSFDVGLLTHPRFPDQKKIKCHKPALKEVIIQSESYTAEKNLQPVKYNIEIKRVPSYDHTYHPEASVFVQLVYKVITDNGIRDRTTIQSFDATSLKEVKKLDNQISTALLVDFSEQYLSKIDELGFIPEILSPHYMLVNTAMKDYCISHRIKLIPWTVNTEQQIQKLLEIGVDGIISDYPDRVMEVIRSKHKAK